MKENWEMNNKVLTEKVKRISREFSQKSESFQYTVFEAMQTIMDYMEGGQLNNTIKEDYLITTHYSLKEKETVNLIPKRVTIDIYYKYPAKQFCPKSSYLSAIYDGFKTKVLKVVE